MTDQKTLTPTLTKPQSLMYYNSYKYPAFIAGFGTGKTVLLAHSAILDAIEGGSESRILIMQLNYSMISEVIFPLIEQLLHEYSIAYKVNKHEKTIKPLKNQGVGEFYFKSYDRPEQIVATAYFRAHLDELDVLSQDKADQVFKKVLGRMRQNPSTYKKITERVPRAVYTYTTPEGFRFAYSKWGDENIDRAKGFDIVKASTYSNPFLDPDYIQSMLDNYPAALIKAYLHGEFVNLNSGAVYPDFDRSLNCTDMTWEDMGDEYDLLIGMDFNIYNCTATVCINHKNGNLYVVDEFIKVRDTQSMCLEIIARYGQDIINRCYIYPDSSGKNNHTAAGAGRSDLDIIASFGFRIYVEPTNPRVSDRIINVNYMILNGNGKRRLFVNTSTCKQLTSSLEQQAYKDGKPDKSSNLDHSPETLGYVIVRTHPIYTNISDRYVQNDGLLYNA